MKLATLIVALLLCCGCAQKRTHIAVPPPAPEIEEPEKWDDCSYVNYFERTNCTKTLNWLT